MIRLSGFIHYRNLRCFNKINQTVFAEVEEALSIIEIFNKIFSKIDLVHTCRIYVGIF